ncbi:MAG: response regulator [Sphingobacteriales bacterium]|nr:response regulator [Sphingobacteriales bacterium]
MIKHILVVEDDENIREVLEYILNDSGYEVKSTSTAREFFHKIEASNPDLIILDINLPDGDGRELCKAIKSNVRTKNIPVIMMSASLNISEILKESGANDFIPKPFNIDSFLNHVDIQLKGAHAQ